MDSPLGANLAFVLKARVQLLRDYGSAISPFNAFLVNLGLETLSLRMDRQVASALAVTRHLEGHPQVESSPTRDWSPAPGTSARSGTCRAGRARSSPSRSPAARPQARRSWTA